MNPLTETRRSRGTTSRTDDPPEQDDPASREVMDQTLEQALDAVVMIDERNVVTFFNRAAEELWGYSRDEIIGQNVRVLVPPEMRGRHDSFVDRNRRTGVDKIVGTSREVPVHRKDGAVVWGSLSLSKVRFGGEIFYTAFVRDVDAEVRRREQFRLLSMVANETDNSVVITGPDRRIEYVNRGFERLTGYTLDEVRGKKPGSFLQGPHTNSETVGRIRGKLAANEPFYDEILNYTKQGEPYWISLAINPVFDDSGKLRQYISIQTEITATKRAAEENRLRLDAIGKRSGMAEWDANGQLEAANDFLLGCTGSPDVVSSRPQAELRRLLSSEQWAVLEREGSLQCSLKWPTKDGARCVAFDAVFSLVRDVDGALVKTIFFGSDATDRARVVEQTNATMKDVLGSSREIERSLERINVITTKIDLMALNAAIEAARAGKAGRGFSVVADGVRRLADESTKVSQDITASVEQSTEQIEQLAARLSALA